MWFLGIMRVVYQMQCCSPLSQMALFIVIIFLQPCWWLSASLDMATSRLKWVITRGWSWSALPSISWSDSSFSHPAFHAITVVVNETKNLILSGLSFQQMIHPARTMGNQPKYYLLAETGSRESISADQSENWTPYIKNVHIVYFLGWNETYSLRKRFLKSPRPE